MDTVVARGEGIPSAIDFDEARIGEVGRDDGACGSDGVGQKDDDTKSRDDHEGEWTAHHGHYDGVRSQS